MKRYEAFILKVNVHPGNSCWNWAGSKSGSGYGQFWDGDRLIPAHWFLLEEYPPKGKEACHKCDNKLCVRPSHIFIGTRSDNVRDCVSKGRLRPKKSKMDKKTNEKSLADKLIKDARKTSSNVDSQIEILRFWRDVTSRGNLKAQIACSTAIDKLKGYYK